MISFYRSSILRAKATEPRLDEPPGENLPYPRKEFPSENLPRPKRVDSFKCGALALKPNQPLIR